MSITLITLISVKVIISFHSKCFKTWYVLLLEGFWISLDVVTNCSCWGFVRVLVLGSLLFGLFCNSRSCWRLFVSKLYCTYCISWLLHYVVCFIYHLSTIEINQILIIIFDGFVKIGHWTSFCLPLISFRWSFKGCELLRMLLLGFGSHF